MTVPCILKWQYEPMCNIAQSTGIPVEEIKVM